METLEYWFGLAESLAVIIGLIAIFVQVRHARIATQGNSYQSLVDGFTQLQLTLAQDEHLSHIFFTGRKQYEDLTEREKERFYLICSNYFIFHENLFLQWQKGTLPDDVYKSWKTSIMNNMNKSGFLIYWERLQDEYNNEFRGFMNKLVNSVYERQ